MDHIDPALIIHLRLAQVSSSTMVTQAPAAYDKPKGGFVI